MRVVPTFFFFYFYSLSYSSPLTFQFYYSFSYIFIKWSLLFFLFFILLFLILKLRFYFPFFCFVKSLNLFQNPIIIFFFLFLHHFQTIPYNTKNIIFYLIFLYQNIYLLNYSSNPRFDILDLLEIFYKLKNTRNYSKTNEVN